MKTSVDVGVVVDAGDAAVLLILRLACAEAGRELGPRVLDESGTPRSLSCLLSVGCSARTFIYVHVSDKVDTHIYIYIYHIYAADIYIELISYLEIRVLQD